MAWKGSRYYVRNVKRCGQVVTEYVGGGAVGAAAAAEDTRRRADRAEERARRHLLRTWSAALDDYCAAVERVVRTALAAAGYHRHDRGRWRKRRVSTTEGECETATGDR